MDINTLKTIFKTAGILPVFVEREDGGFPFSKKDPRVVGPVEEYVSALTTLKAPVVLVYTLTLTKDDFLYSSDGNDEDSDEAGDARGDGHEVGADTDLCTVNPALTRFRKHIGGIAVFLLSSPLQRESLDYMIEEDWYPDYVEQWDEAVRVIDAASEVEASKADFAEQARFAQLLEAMEALVDDQKFVRLPTQKAMLAYARDKIPGLNEMDHSTLKDKIQELNAKIAARRI